MGRDLLVSNLSKAIGDGESTRIWKDPWLSSLKPVKPIGPPQEKHQDLFVADLLCRGNQEWNIQKISNVLPFYVEDILSIKPSITGAADSYVWLASKSGVYSAKSGYFVVTALEEENSAHEKNLYKAIWSCKTSPKLHLFLWKVVQGAWH